MPDSNLKNRSLDSLLAAVVDERATSAELAELEQRLDGDSEAQRYYLHYLELHSRLTEEEINTPAVTIAPQNRRAWMTIAMATMAVALVLAPIILLRTSIPAPLVKVTDLDGAVVWISDGEARSDIKVGEQLPSGTIETLAPNSSAELEFPDGTTVSVAGQSSLSISQIDGQKILRLREGDLSINAAEQEEGAPMQIFTPSAQAEVLGTQFHVAANQYSARIVVNEGLVRVTRLSDGKVEEVTSKEVVVASLEQDTEFLSQPRQSYVETWTSELPRDQLQGRWEPSNDNASGGLRAMPHLWRGDPGESQITVLLYSAVMDPSVGRRPPVKLTDSTQITVSGRIDREELVRFGFGTNRRRGGPVGKYSVGIQIRPEEEGQFKITIPLSNFNPNRSHFPETPVGHEVDWLWVQTVRVDAGLIVEEVSIH